MSTSTEDDLPKLPGPPTIAAPFRTGFEYICLIHQASPEQVGFITRQSARVIWKRFKFVNTALGHPYDNKLPIHENPTLDQLQVLWTSYTALHDWVLEPEPYNLTAFLALVDPWISDFRLPQRA